MWVYKRQLGKDFLRQKHHSKESEIKRAKVIKEAFKLPFTAGKIAKVWKFYSGYCGAEWLRPSRSDIEKAFNVELEWID